jgi:MoxR-like ATPase
METAGIAELARALREEVGRVVVGQARAIELFSIALLAEGHVLLEGLPGTAKTLLARAFAATLALRANRIQFTPDLMPGDILGTHVFDFSTGRFALTRGPVFTDVLIADEINRTPPKTQAALLQAMQERAVTLDGETHDLGPGFLVLATQNPLEQEGTYPLPEAQLDRFLFRVRIDYPSREEELLVVRRHGVSSTSPRLESFGLHVVADIARIAALRAELARVLVSEAVLAYAVDLVRATREEPALSCGASPRAASMLVTGARARALLEGRGYVLPDDVKDLAVPTLAHRVVLAPTSELEGLSAERAIEGLLERVPAPR